MNCLKPTQAWIDSDRFTANGKQLVSWSYDEKHWHVISTGLVNDRLKPVREILVPCGKCILCKRRRAFEIGIRARCESVCHDVSCFVTLTVSDENLLHVFPGGRLNHRSFQLFAKRLRKVIGPFRFIMCGEYGEVTHRPHYHVIVFGHQFLDSFYDERGVFHASKLLEGVWPFGHVTCDRLNDSRIMYVAGYVLKSSSDEYPSYVRWSRRPGLGARWFDKFWSSCYKRDGFDFNVGAEKVCSAVVWQRKLTPLACRYFDERLLLHDERLYDILKSYRLAKVGSFQDDTPDVVHSREFQEFLLQGLMNRVEVLTKKLASRTRDLQNTDYATYPEVDVLTCFDHLKDLRKQFRERKSSWKDSMKDLKKLIGDGYGRT